MKIVQRKVADLHEDPENLNTHDERSVKAIAAALKRFGQQKPVVLKGDTVIAGSGTLLAAKSLGWDTIATVATKLEGAELDAYKVADNRVAELSSWEDRALAEYLASIEDPELLTAVGFTDDELADVLSVLDDEPPEGDDGEPGEGASGPPDATPEPEGRTDEDDAPEAAPEPRVKPGELWRLGRHLLLCGDSGQKETLATLMGDERADCMFTDPPYGVVYGAQNKGKRKRSGYKPAAELRIVGDTSGAAFATLLAVSLPFVKPNRAVYVFGGVANLVGVFRLFEAHLGRLPEVIVWDKGSFTLRHSGFHSAYELLFYTWTEGGGKPEERWFGDRKATTIWKVKRDPSKEYVHPTQKPVELAETALRYSTPDGGLVLDPFAGSGSTLIAAEKLGRTCYAVEIDPVYADVIVRRWELFTGKQAKCLSTE